MTQETQFTDLREVKWELAIMLYPLKQNDGKNACRVYSPDGSYDDVRQRCDTMRDELLKRYFVNLKKAESIAIKCPDYPRKRRVCIKLEDDITLVPLICREAPRRNAGSMGYVIMEWLYDVKQAEDGGTLLQFYEDHKGVHIMQKYGSATQQFAFARQLERCYQQDAEYRQMREEQRRQRDSKTHIVHHKD